MPKMDIKLKTVFLYIIKPCLDYSAVEAHIYSVYYFGKLNGIFRKQKLIICAEEEQNR